MNVPVMCTFHGTNAIVERWVPCKVAGCVKNMFEEMAKNPTKSRLKEQIDQNLKRVYEEVAKEEVPDRFKLLLQQLKDKERGN